ncbi:MAG TPA: twin-arginine translocase TatA/TatE family subunit [Kofleriaceae bacterium]|nr:twin-arginine translocase TatA/TatE family subunit [Kofleriaceae bacterium]
MPGPMELVLILLIVLLIFGAGKLPAIGDALGRSIKNFKRSAAGDDEIEVSKTREVSGGQRSELKAGGADAVDEADAEMVSSKKS